MGWVEFERAKVRKKKAAGLSRGRLPLVHYSNQAVMLTWRPRSRCISTAQLIIYCRRRDASASGRQMSMAFSV